MPKLAPALTHSQILSLQPREKSYKVSDGKCLYLLILPSGKKYWRMSSRVLGKETTICGDTYPEMSVLQARQWREKIETLIASGIDPNEQKREQRKIERIAKPMSPKLKFMLQDDGSLILENYANRLILNQSQVTALKAFLHVSPTQIEGS